MEKVIFMYYFSSLYSTPALEYFVWHMVFEMITVVHFH